MKLSENSDFSRKSSIQRQRINAGYLAAYNPTHRMFDEEAFDLEQRVRYAACCIGCKYAHTCCPTYRVHARTYSSSQ